MDTTLATRALSTLGHPGRLATFRLLMRFAPQGVRPTEIATALAVKQNTLSHHLSDLVASGLANVDRDGRSLFYSVNIEVAEALLSYLALDMGRARPDLIAPIQASLAAPSNGPWNVLFICSKNSARSIMAETLLRDLAPNSPVQIRAASAGTLPNSTLNLWAVETLARNGHDTSNLRAKHITEFQQPDAPLLDFVFTVCDAAAARDCAPWPRHPFTAHWGVPDPVSDPASNTTDTDHAAIFAQTYALLRHRITAFLNLPFTALSPICLQTHLDAIGTDAPKQG